MEYVTTGFSGYGVKYSPFADAKIAVAGARNFGLVGNGRLYVLNLTAHGILEDRIYDTQDALYDLAWSENNPNQLLAACGDGSVMLYDTSVEQYPVATWKEHQREVYATSWNLITKDTFVTSSWDGTIKLWTPERSESLLTLPTHSCTYSATFSPHNPAIISSCTSDSHIRIFDLRTPNSAQNHLVKLVPIHGARPMIGEIPRQFPPAAPSEALSHDWNKYRDGVIAVAGVDTNIRIFDLRNTREPSAILSGHRYAVRRVAWSPHLSDTLLSASYDMSIRVWTDGTTPGPQAYGQPGSGPRQLGQFDRHTEFCTGVDWCLFGAEGWCASTAWDQRLCVWDVRRNLGVPNGPQ